MKRLTAIAIVLWAVSVAAGAQAPAAPAQGRGYADVLIKDVPHVRQKPDFCGEACAEMALTKLGKKWTQDDVFNQEKGLLVKFYRQFAAGQKDDPTGYKTLKAVLGEADMAAFQKRWVTYVSGLRFP
jgi:hypothetical protein